jgi:thiol:disulfide interchange protein
MINFRYLLSNNITILLFLFLSGFQIKAQSDIVKMKLIPNSIRAGVNSKFEVILNVNIEKDWHINSNKPNDENLIPTEISIQNKWLKILSIKYPNPKELSTPINEKPVFVFEGNEQIRITFEVNKTVSCGILKIPVKFTYQACNDRTCMSPNSIIENILIEIVAEKNNPSEFNNDKKPKIPIQEDSILGGKKDSVANLTVLPVHSNLSEKKTNLITGILFAFIGGLILNLMPCVLPVLSLKILGFVKQAGENKRKVFNHGLLFTMGVIISFWILAGILIILRSGGETLGWGFQLQSPVFLIILIVFFFLFSLSLFGVFEIGNSFTRLNGRSNGYFGSFMSGVTATIVATPCTAPFMGSALGFALMQPAYYSMIIFTFIGFGMSLPYIILSANPKFLKYIPKAGLWMETFKQIIGFLLVATTLWLIWILSNQIEFQNIIILLFALLFVTIGAWIWGKWGTIVKSSRVRIASLVISAFLIFGSTYETIKCIQENRNNKTVEWLNYSPELISKLKQQKAAYFIDFTAKWCLTCQVNKKAVLHSTEVQEAFRKYSVIPIIADWTNNDEKIAKALSEFNRNSVPFYVLYSHNPDKKPVILPELLTPGIVIEALENL